MLVMLNISYIPKKKCLAEHFLQKISNFKNCSFVNSKLRHVYISASFRNFQNKASKSGHVLS